MSRQLGCDLILSSLTQQFLYKSYYVISCSGSQSVSFLHSVQYWIERVHPSINISFLSHLSQNKIAKSLFLDSFSLTSLHCVVCSRSSCSDSRFYFSEKCLRKCLKFKTVPAKLVWLTAHLLSCCMGQGWGLVWCMQG